MRSPEDWLAEVRKAFDGRSIDYVVIGAVAAMKYRATPRATADVDVLTAHLAEASAALRGIGFDVQESLDPDGQPFLLAAVSGDAKIHVLLAETDYQREAIRRATAEFLTPEDVIVHKLIAWRPRDRDDIESILLSGCELDDSYIERWASEWGVEERWAAVRRG